MQVVLWKTEECWALSLVSGAVWSLPAEITSPAWPHTFSNVQWPNLLFFFWVQLNSSCASLLWTRLNMKQMIPCVFPVVVTSWMKGWGNTLTLPGFGSVSLSHLYLRLHASQDENLPVACLNGLICSCYCGSSILTVHINLTMWTYCQKLM